MSITYSDVEKYISRVALDIKYHLTTLEASLIEARDTHSVPIHLMKWRIKSADSAYLKTKRKAKTSLDDVTDIGGFRVLCMFEQDIIPAHKCLVSLLKSQGFGLREFRIFNWHDKTTIEVLQAEVRSHFSDQYTEVIDDKESGYRSLHYVVTRQSNGKLCNIEIQLRTLLQDVWAELEHALSYKQGSTHPHIKKSFSLLARDLETSDNLIRHLRDISDKEHYIETFALQHTGPHEVFWYEGYLIPDLVQHNDELGRRFSAYKEFVCRARDGRDLTQWASEAEQLYKQVKDSLKASDLDSVEVGYWIEAEKAFLLFCKGDFAGALESYERLTMPGCRYYVPHFRRGEILFIKGDIEQSLVSFDKSEELLESQGASGLEIDPINAYRLKVKIANIYWLLGSEYVDIALSKILEAEDVVKRNPGLLGETDRRKLVNNLCWYQLEKYLLSNETFERSQIDADGAMAANHYASACERYGDLEQILDDDATSSNMYDTAAWHCFHAYKREKDPDLLTKAKRYCELGWVRKNEAVRKITSANVHRNHIREIMSAN